VGFLLGAKLMTTPHQIKAYELHADIAKQQISLSTALIAAIIAISKIEAANIEFTCGLVVGVVSFLLSTVLGLFHLGALSHVSELGGSIQDSKPSLWTARLQQILFFVAMGISIFALL